MGISKYRTASISIEVQKTFVLGACKLILEIYRSPFAFESQSSHLAKKFVLNVCPLSLFRSLPPRIYLYPYYMLYRDLFIDLTLFRQQTKRAIVFNANFLFIFNEQSDDDDNDGTR